MKTILLFLIIVLSMVTLTSPTKAEVDIPSASLRRVISEALGKAADDPITEADMLTLIELDARSGSIQDLTGLQHATNLKTLLLERNKVVDISPLLGLTQLTDLDLRYNDISDVSSLGSLIQLTDLDLGGNDISDVSSLGSLIQLTDLDLGENDISDVSSLGSLTQLTALNLGGNDISDVSSLGSLTQLTNLDLGGNDISDVSSLGSLTQLTVLSLSSNLISDVSPLLGLTQLTALTLWSNRLSYQSLHTHIPSLEAEGVNVYINIRGYGALVKISGDGQRGIPGNVLSAPFVVQVVDENAVAFANVPVRFAVIAGGGRLSTTATTTDANGKAYTTLTLGPTTDTYTVHATTSSSIQPVTFTETASPSKTVIETRKSFVIDGYYLGKWSRMFEFPGKVLNVRVITELTTNTAPGRSIFPASDAISDITINGNKVSLFGWVFFAVRVSDWECQNKIKCGIKGEISI